MKMIKSCEIGIVFFVIKNGRNKTDIRQSKISNTNFFLKWISSNLSPPQLCHTYYSKTTLMYGKEIGFITYPRDFFKIPFVYDPAGKGISEVNRPI